MSPPTLSPPALKFLVIDYSYRCLELSISFVATTDVPCHLYLHLSNELPVLRRIPYKKRGADFFTSSVTCFVEAKLIEQNESGDTTTHTFTVPLIAYCQYIYFYLTGTQGSIPCTSISQIFSIHCSGPELPTTKCHATDGSLSGIGVYNCYEFATPFTPSKSFEARSVDIRYCRHGSTTQCTKGRLRIWNTDTYGKPTSLAFGNYTFTAPSLDPNQCHLHNIQFPDHPQLIQGNRYAIAFVFWEKGARYNPRYISFTIVNASNSCPQPPPCTTKLYNQIYLRQQSYPCGYITTPWRNWFTQQPLYYKFYGFDL